jgi:hypothetical protein
MNTPQEPASVRIIDIKMPFGSLVVFMVKWTIAAIPALIILAIIGALLSGLLVGMFSGTHHHQYQNSSRNSSSGSSLTGYVLMSAAGRSHSR